MSATRDFILGAMAHKPVTDPHTAGAALDKYRTEVRREVGEWLLTQQVREPLGEAEEHVNDVLQDLARELGAGE